MDDKDFLNISFREGGKTVWAMAYVMWCIIHKKYHFIMWYNFDKSKSNKRLYDIIVQFQTNERINRLYGTFMPDLKGSDSKTKRSVAEFITSNGVMVKSASIGMSPRGEIYVSKDGTAHRPGLVLLDDIDTLKSVASVEIIDKNYRFIKDELMPGMS